MAEELLINIDIKGEDSLNNLETKLDKTAKTGKKTTNALAELRKVLKDSKADMVKYEEGTDEYNAALKRAASSADKLRDINDKVIFSQKDVGVVAKNVAGSVAGLAAGFATAQGVIGLFGAENEALTKTMLKVQSALTVTQGLSNFVDAFDSMKDLWGAIKLRITETVAAKNADTIATNANTVAVEANNIANKSNVKSLNNTRTEVNNLSDSTKNLSNETALVSSNLTKTTNSSLADYSNMIKRVKEENILLNQVNKDYQKQLKKVSDINDPIEQQFIRNTKEKIKGNKELINQNNQHIQAISQLTKNQTTFVGTMIKSIAVMGAYALAIGGAIYVITKLIEWINKIPQNIKLNVEIGSEAINQTKTLREDILKFQSDYTRAQQNNNFQHLKGLDEIAKKQYGLSQAQINNINNTKDGWKQFFKDYLKLAEDTYYNEALIKRTVEKQILLETAEAELNANQNIIDKYSEQLNAAREKNVSKVGVNTIGMLKTITNSEYIEMSKVVSNLKGQQDDLKKKIEESKKSLETLNLVKPKESANYFTNIVETKDIKQTVTQNVQYGQFEMPDSNQVKEYLDKLEKPKVEFKPFSLVGTDKDAEYELSKLKELYEKGKITTDEYLSKKYDILKFAEDRGIDLTETSYNVQAQIVENAEEKKRESIRKTAQAFEDSIETASMLNEALSTLNQAEMDEINAKADLRKEQNEQEYQDQIKLINNSKMSEEEKNKALTNLENDRLKNDENIEAQRYKLLKKQFNIQKGIDIAQAWINASSGIVGIWSRSYEGGLFGGPVIASIQSAALVALAAAQTKAIAARRMDRPVQTAGATTSTSSTSSYAPKLNNAALNPTKTSLTSKEENINKMNNYKQTQSVVKVSDINNVQKIVSVRNNNTSY